MSARVPLSILDLVHVTEGGTMAEAISHSMAGAQLADELGYSRLWFAEHHNTPFLGASATSVLIGRATSLTKRIRVGSGGIMLPNHAPLRVAEDFGTLSQLFPGRIDLGVGRAPGTDPVAGQALRRTGSDLNSFGRDIQDLNGWFSDEGMAESLPITGGVATGTKVPIWVLGSSSSGAAAAGHLGLPFCVASHFSPAETFSALQVYRQTFNPQAPTAQVERPYVMAAINVAIAPTDEEAQRMWTTAQRMILDVRSGNRRKLQPPVAPGSIGTVAERAYAESMLGIKAVGSPAAACKALEAFAEATHADELITMTYAHDPAGKFHSMRLLAENWF
ncbi:LLM class flavin-dependent oxidoreductase [Arthrobacter sp. ISL-72]|uniref:LLM class flavin-dependent oxidoreductase n=1 Tax=Arthrobacter sp. ISL-72 TaxID=2819114 RepID=UPI001BE8B123|nr:LLM class flavin-dependent oxidoreductase [Arthrobacter sp. ISL-72]MBT2597885.1 LLM class flavin-dependent oxidoreductase [Arthrobacter sp. ISL-72]